MNLKNEHLIPEIIINLVDKYKKASSQNERYALEDRLKAIRDVVSDTLANTKKPYEGLFKKK